MSKWSWQDINHSRSLKILLGLMVFVGVFLAMPGGRLLVRRVWTMATYRFIHLPKMEARARIRMRAAAGADMTLPLPDARVVIHKSARRAELYAGEQLIKTYKIALGGQPVGDKSRLGDERTPEETFYVCVRLDRSQYHLFLGLNYPTAKDAERGLKAGLIGEETSQAITQAEQRQKVPDWKTQLGGAIGLHGGGTERDWTDGCVAFNDQDIEEIWVATGYWATVEIRP